MLMELAGQDQMITVLCSDSRGSGSMTEFANRFPDQFVEVGIAEQSLVSMAAGMASTGRKPVAVSPASFLSTRSMEQVKVDCAYSHNNVLLLGISGGVSYGAPGHDPSLQHRHRRHGLYSRYAGVSALGPAPDRAVDPGPDGGLRPGLCPGGPQRGGGCL